MKTPNKLFLAFALSLILLNSCTPTSKKETEESPPPPIAEISYCNMDDSTLCLEGFGEENEENLIILFKSNSSEFKDIYLRINKNGENIPYQCAQSQEFPENIYCIGDFFPNDEEITIGVYTFNNDTPIGKGKFTIQYGDLQLSDDVEFENSPTFPDYPNYPNYPND